LRKVLAKNNPFGEGAGWGKGGYGER